MTDSAHSTLSDADLVLVRSTLFRNTLNIPMPPRPALRERADIQATAGRPAERAEPLNGMAQSLLGLAEVARARGDLAAAEEHYRRALAIFESLSAVADTADRSATSPGEQGQRSNP